MCRAQSPRQSPRRSVGGCRSSEAGTNYIHHINTPVSTQANYAVALMSVWTMTFPSSYPTIHCPPPIPIPIWFIGLLLVACLSPSPSPSLSRCGSACDLSNVAPENRLLPNLPKGSPISNPSVMPSAPFRRLTRTLVFGSHAIRVPLGLIYKTYVTDST